MEDQCFLHPNCFGFMADRSVFSGCFPVPFAGSTIQTGTIAVLPIYRAEEVPFKVSRL